MKGLSNESQETIQITVFGFAALSLSATAIAGPPTARVTGTLAEIDGVRVLRIWGPPEERGFAYGYLMGEEIPRFMEGFLASGTILDVEGYKNRILPRLGLIKIQPEYEA